MEYRINPMQLAIYLKMAIEYAHTHDADLPKAKELCKQLMKVTWDENAELIIKEK